MSEPEQAQGEHWTVEVCNKCGKVHRSRRRSSCIVEYDPAGDTMAGTMTVEVVRRSRFVALQDILAGRDEAAIGRAARALAGDPPCYCPDDWRQPYDETQCPLHSGEGPARDGWLDRYRRKAADALSAAGRTEEDQ